MVLNVAMIVLFKSGAAILSSKKITRKWSRVGRNSHTIGLAEISSVGLIAVMVVQRIGVMKKAITRIKAKYFANVFTAYFLVYAPAC